MESGEDDDDEAEKDKKNNNDTANTTFVNPSQLESEMVEFDVFVKCKDHWLRNGQSLYTQRLNNIPAVERVEYTALQSRAGSRITTHEGK